MQNDKQSPLGGKVNITATAKDIAQFVGESRRILNVMERFAAGIDSKVEKDRSYTTKELEIFAGCLTENDRNTLESMISLDMQGTVTMFKLRPEYDTDCDAYVFRERKAADGGDAPCL